MARIKRRPYRILISFTKWGRDLLVELEQLTPYSKSEINEDLLVIAVLAIKEGFVPEILRKKKRDK